MAGSLACLRVSIAGFVVGRVDEPMNEDEWKWMWVEYSSFSSSFVSWRRGFGQARSRLSPKPLAAKLHLSGGHSAFANAAAAVQPPCHRRVSPHTASALFLASFARLVAGRTAPVSPASLLVVCRYLDGDSISFPHRLLCGLGNFPIFFSSA